MQTRGKQPVAKGFGGLCVHKCNSRGVSTRVSAMRTCGCCAIPATRSAAATVSCLLLLPLLLLPSPRYLMQQGYAGEGEITILTPYVGQLLRLREAVKQQGGMRLLISERDEADLQHALDAADAEEAAEEGAAAAGGGDGNTTAEGTSSLGRQGSGAGNTSGGGDGAAAAGAPGGGGGTRVVEFQQALRLATVDNFQVSCSAVLGIGGPLRFAESLKGCFGVAGRQQHTRPTIAVSDRLVQVERWCCSHVV